MASNPEWDKGFQDGLAYAHANYVPGQSLKLPDNFVHRGGGWHNGFGEGLITGRRQVFDAKYPGNIGFSCNEGKLTVFYPEGHPALNKK